MAALPALSKTYHAHANVPFPDTSTAALIGKSFFWALKALLTNATGLGGTQSGTRPAGSIWTHVASCDSVSVSTGTDLWPDAFDATKLVPNTSGSAHSWWRGTNGTHDIVIDMNSATAGSGRIAMAPAGAFSAGSTTAGPTASTDWYAGTTTNNSSGTAIGLFTDTSATGSAMRAHLVTNTTDFSFQFLTSRVGTGIFNCFLSLQKTTGANDSYNNFLLHQTKNTQRGAPGVNGGFSTAAGCVGRTHSNSGVIGSGGFSYPVSGGTLIAGTYGTDAVTGDYWADPVEVRDLSPTYIAKRGTIVDFYTVGAPAVGSSVPSAAAQERVVVGDLLVPFPSVVPTV